VSVSSPDVTPSQSPSLQPLIVAITGATGACYGIEALRLLHQAGVETHLVVSPAGRLTIAAETDLALADVYALADVVYQPKNVGAAISSGSFQSGGMLIAPCSMRTLGEIASGVTSSLVSRAADVTLKERRRLVLLTRETPLNLIHLRNMVTLTEAGGVIMPPIPAFYHRPTSIDEIVTQTVARALTLLGVNVELRAWDGLS